MLQLDLKTSEQWKNARLDKPVKWKNAHYFDTFNSIVQEYSTDFVGNLKYYANTGIIQEHTLQDKHPLLEYSENSPIFRFFKLSPEGFYIYKYETRKEWFNLWKNTDIDSSIINFIKEKNTNKYEQNINKFDFGHEYILFTLQSLYVRFDLKIFVECVVWAEKNKKYLIFKKHPFSVPGDHIDQAWSRLESKGIIKKYAILITHEYNLDYLIKNAKMVWCFSSGTGMQALLENKPVSFFSWNVKGRARPYVDYAPVAKHCSTPAEAYENTGATSQDLLRFFSWYYYKLIIDLDSVNAKDQIYNRLVAVFNERKKVEEIF